MPPTAPQAADGYEHARAGLDRGPNQPRNPDRDQRIPMPSMARATWSIRTTVRLATAYSATRQSSSPRAGPSSTTPNSRKVRAGTVGSWYSSQAFYPWHHSRRGPVR
jgi:hypothetical protein